jgi:hypothetical protein
MRNSTLGREEGNGSFRLNNRSNSGDEISVGKASHLSSLGPASHSISGDIEQLRFLHATLYLLIGPYGKIRLTYPTYFDADFRVVSILIRIYSAV